MTTSELLGHQFLPNDDAMTEIYGLIDKSRPIDVWEMMRSYTLGVIMGKRMERARCYGDRLQARREYVARFCHSKRAV